MNQLSTFSFESSSVRVSIDDNGEPLFVAADILSTLNLDRKALERLDDDEKGVSSIHTPGGRQEMTVITESGLFSLVLGSRKPEAKRFKRWVTHEVLPSIRKTGAYVQDGPMSPQQTDVLVVGGEKELRRAMRDFGLVSETGFPTTKGRGLVTRKSPNGHLWKVVELLRFISGKSV